MASKRLVIFPLPEHGHIYPTLSIAQHYASKGCEVIYLTASQFRQTVEATGARLAPVYANEDKQPSSGQRLLAQLTGEGSSDRRSQVITELLRVYAADHPCDLFLLDRHLATSYGCNLESALLGKERMFFASSLLRWDRAESAHLDRTTLVLCPEELEVPKFRNNGPLVRYVEPSIYQPVGGYDGQDLLPTSGSLVLVVWGTQSARYTRLPAMLQILIALARSRADCHFVTAIGTNLRLWAILAEADCENIVVRESIPQQLLLRKASAVITHGGLNTLKECIFSEVPVLVLPFLSDQPLNALRIVHHGLGAALFPEEQTLSALSSQLDLAICGSFAPGLREMQQVFAEQEARKPSHALLDNFLQ